jgi:hypothetical protein
MAPTYCDSCDAELNPEEACPDWPTECPSCHAEYGCDFVAQVTQERLV